METEEVQAQLFAGYEPTPDPEEHLSAGQRLTRRQHAQVQAGIHPLTGRPIHPDASREAAPGGPRGTPLTCGACRFRISWGARSYPKCYLPGPNGDPIPARLTHAATTDVRRWWPACPDYQERT